MDDHNLMAKQEHIEAIEAELDRMKKIATHVYEEMVSHMRRTSYSTHSTCFGSTLLTYSYSTYSPQVYMRDRSDAMHITSESTRGRHRSIWLVAHTVSAVPQQCRSSSPRASLCWLLAPGLSLAVGLAAQSEKRPICSEPGRRANWRWARPIVWRIRTIPAITAPISRLFTLGRLLSRRCAVVNNLLDLPRRLLWVEVSMMCVLLFMGLWQIHYLKRYFQTKKLI